MKVRACMKGECECDSHSPFARDAVQVFTNLRIYMNILYVLSFSMYYTYQYIRIEQKCMNVHIYT